jgi:hypothetical protein
MARGAGRTSDRSGEGRTRTGDTPVFSRVLYQLSYLAAGAGQSNESSSAPGLFVAATDMRGRRTARLRREQDRLKIVMPARSAGGSSGVELSYLAAGAGQSSRKEPAI